MLKVLRSQWFTNLSPPPVLKREYLCKYEPEHYPLFDNFHAININKSIEIPVDYDGLMAVPITYLDKHEPERFEIIGVLNHGKDGDWDFCKPLLNGKEVYKRIIIKRK